MFSVKVFEYIYFFKLYTNLMALYFKCRNHKYFVLFYQSIRSILINVFINSSKAHYHFYTSFSFIAVSKVSNMGTQSCKYSLLVRCNRNLHVAKYVMEVIEENTFFNPRYILSYKQDFQVLQKSKTKQKMNASYKLLTFMNFSFLVHHTS